MSVGSHQLVAAIEGYPYLFTDGSTSAALTAWAGSQWTQCLPGLVADVDLQQSIDPYDPIRGGGSCRLYIHPDSTDRFGIDVARTNAGASTYLDLTADRSNTTLTVVSTTGFASSGEACIGSETFSYTGKTATTFTGCTRGKYAPFPSDEFAPLFAQHHRVGNVDYGVPLNPLVTQYHRTWRGRWVGLWLHTKTGSTLQSRSSARVLYAGRIAEIYDDPQTGCTVLDVEHVLDVVRNATVLRDPWAAHLREGVYLITGSTFDLTDHTASDGSGDANPLLVVTSGAAGANQVNEGYYTADEICDVLNTWLASELTAARIKGSYQWSVKTYDDGPRVSCAWTINTATANTACYWEISLPQHGTMLAMFLGLTGGHIGSGGRWFSGHISGLVDAVYDDASGNEPSYHGGEAPFRVFLVRGQAGGGGTERQIEIADTRGIFIDQDGTLPALAQPLADQYPGNEWGIFDIDGGLRVVAALDGSDLKHVQPLPTLSIGIGTLAPSWDQFIGRRMGDGTGPVEIRQVVMIVEGFARVVRALFASTGTLGYNHLDDDAFPGYGMGIALPYSLLGEFGTSVDNLSAADMQIALQVDRATKLVDLIKADLILRRAHLVFKDGSLRLISWSTPTAGGSGNEVHTLGSDQKAEPAGNQSTHRAASRLSSDWARPIMKIKYNRAADGTYLATFTIEDRTAIDDLGGQGEVVEVPARNVWADGTQVGQGVLDLLPAVIAWHAFFSRPIRLLTRSLSMSIMLDVAPGDIALVSDPFARDPITGARGIADRAGLVTQVRASLGGPTPGAPSVVRAPVAEVTVAFLELERVTVYSPCAEVDEAVTGGGFDAGYNSGVPSLRCKAHAHSSTIQPVDASHFEVGDQIVIVEIDPSDPAAPTFWEREVVSVSLNDIEIDSALSAPAWDNTKQYRIISQDYNHGTATQQADCYQADDADGTVQDAVGPYLYGDANLAQTFVRSAHDDLPELSADLAATDGAPRDTGYERGLMRTINNLIDHKLSAQTPMLDAVWRNPTGLGLPANTYRIHSVTPIFLGGYQQVHGTRKSLWVAPIIRSTDGVTTAVCKVSLCSLPPQGDSFTSATLQGAVSSAVFTTLDTAGVVPSAQQLSLALLSLDAAGAPGLAYLVIEFQDKCETMGLAQAVIRERVF